MRAVKKHLLNNSFSIAAIVEAPVLNVTILRET